MIDNDRLDIERQLDELRSELVTLRELPLLSPRFTNWLLKLYRLVESHFGVSSNELAQLRAIYPELPPEFYDSVSLRLEGLELQSGLSEALHKALRETVPERIFLRRLYDYDDLIASMQLGLRANR